MSLTMPFKLLDWIDDNREYLKPPVCNKQMFEAGDFIVQVVGGPNSRTDYHLDEGPELFFQVEGQMRKTGKIGPEFERMAKMGRVTPDLWMENATGKPVGPDALLTATQEAVQKVSAIHARP